MTTISKSTPGVMRHFKMTRIAAVDSPAQKGALVTIMKRDDTQAFEDFRKRLWSECDDTAYLKLCKRTFTADERKKAEESGAAMPGGRYPIENESDLHNAIRAVGRGKGSHAAIRAHIKTRAKALGLESAIPDDWKASKADESRLRNAIRFADFGLSTEQIGKFAGKIAKDAIDGDPDQAMLFDEVHGSTEACEYAQEMMDEFDECYRDLCLSVRSIMCDDEADDKATLLSETFDQFKRAIQDVVPEAEEPPIAKALGSNKGSEDMALKDIAKALGLNDSASEDAVLKAAEEKKKKADEADKEREKAEKRAKLIEKMSAKHKAFMEHPKAKMPSGGKEAFADMEPAERDAHMKKNPVEDDEDDDEMEKMIAKGTAFRDPETRQIFKMADFGTEAAYAYAKRQAEKNAKLASDFSKSEEARLTAEFAKRAEPLSFIGKADGADGIGQLLHDCAKFDTKLADRVEAVLKGANEKLSTSTLFTEQGRSATGAFGKATTRIDALATELLKNEGDKFKHIKLDKMAAARAEIRKRNPDLVKEEEKEAEEERRTGRRKAA